MDAEDKDKATELNSGQIKFIKKVLTELYGSNPPAIVEDAYAKWLMRLAEEWKKQNGR